MASEARDQAGEGSGASSTAPRREPAARRLEPGSLVRLALGFYGGLAGLALLWRTVLRGESLLFASPEAAARGLAPGRDLAIGVAAASLTVLISHALTRRTRWGRELARALGRALGPIPLRQCLLLALVSGVAEEAFFRGALQPRVGLLAASAIFAAVHFVPRRELALWSAFSFAAGLLLGGLFEVTGNLLAPLVAHVGINAVNLPLLVRGYARERESVPIPAGGTRAG